MKAGRRMQRKPFPLKYKGSGFLFCANKSILHGPVYRIYIFVTPTPLRGMLYSITEGDSRGPWPGCHENRNDIDVYQSRAKGKYT